MHPRVPGVTMFTFALALPIFLVAIVAIEVLAPSWDRALLAVLFSTATPMVAPTTTPMVETAAPAARARPVRGLVYGVRFRADRRDVARNAAPVRVAYPTVDDMIAPAIPGQWRA